MTDYEALIAYGFSPERARVIEDHAKRGATYALAFLDLARVNAAKLP